VTAEARLGRSADDVRRERAETGRTVRFPVEVVVRTEDGTETALQQAVRWAVRPNVR
jgi:hypothetical protein